VVGEALMVVVTIWTVVVQPDLVPARLADLPDDAEANMLAPDRCVRCSPSTAVTAHLRP
jgi:hypothetical protein